MDSSKTTFGREPDKVGKIGTEELLESEEKEQLLECDRL